MQRFRFPQQPPVIPITMATYQNDKSSLDEKIDITHQERGPHYEGVDENGEPIDRATAVVLPESMANLSEEDLASLRKGITRKIDMLIMPSLVTLYILNYLDRQNIAAARLANITTDLGLSTVDYQTCVSILFAGYIAFQVPSNMIISKIRLPGLYICVATATWGVVSALTAAVNNFIGLLMCRFFLGIVEAVFFPAAIFFLSCWYSKKQMAFRTAILYSGSQLGSAFGNLLAIAILKLDNLHGLEGWRWLFLIEGAATVGIALLIIIVLPNKPNTTRWLTREQRECLVYDLEIDRGQKDNSEDISVGRGFWMCCYDPKTWLLMGILFSTYVSAAVSNFFPSVVSTLGYSRNITYALTAPPYILCVIMILINGLHSDRKQERYLHIVVPLCFTMLANVIAVSTLNTAARYVAMMLMPCSFYSSSIVTLSWISSSVNGPAVKRAIVLSLINAICNTPNIWTSYLYKNSPRYLVAFCVNLVAAVIAIGFATLTRIYLKRQNAKMDRGEDTGKSGPSPQQIATGFRYML